MHIIKRNRQYNNLMRREIEVAREPIFYLSNVNLARIEA